MKILIPSAFIVTLALGSCGTMEKKDAPKAQEVTLSALPKNDAEIANSMLTVNTEEMNLAKIGKEKAENSFVKNYAERMFEEHSNNNLRVQKFADEENMRPTETQSSEQIKYVTEDRVEELKKLSGTEFDKAFMNEQVSIHTKVLDKIEQNLIPNAGDDQLKAMLEQNKLKIRGHLNEAKEIRDSI
jgi:putative membrane protein